MAQSVDLPSECHLRWHFSFEDRLKDLDQVEKQEAQRLQEEEQRRTETLFDDENIRKYLSHGKLFEIGERLQRNIKDRMFGELEFFGVDLEDSQSLEQLDDFSRNEFSEFIKGRVARASEWYLAHLVDRDADQLRDLLPRQLREAKFFRYASLRFSQSDRIPKVETKLGGPVAPLDGSTLDQNVDARVIEPYVNAGLGFYEEWLGEIKINGRIRSRNIGAGIGWRPWKDDFPLQFRVDWDENIRSGDQRWEISASMGICDLIERNRKHRQHLYFVTRWDSETDDTWFGLVYSHDE